MSRYTRVEVVIGERAVSPARVRSRGGFVLVAILAALVLSLVATCFAENLVGRSVAGPLFCHTVCEGCHGPGRLFSWSTRSFGGKGRGSSTTRLFCNNPYVDIEALNWLEALERREGDLQPYVLNSWLALPVYLAFFLVLGIPSALVAHTLSVRQRRGALQEPR